MKPRDTALRLKRFEATERARKVASIETMINDFEHVAVDLARQIAAEEERTGIKDPAHYAYSTFAKAAGLRRANLLTSVADLRVKLEAARAEHAEVMLEIGRLEPVETRDLDRQLRKADHPGAAIG
ncbi:MAG TPA: flagellar export protein FliJ [Hyphomicrobiaceae bacterium]|nr:flagellar export protein FliJ [Hyphomicrobiaceae bacterium]